MKPSSTDTQQIEREIEAGNGQAANMSPEQAADLKALHARVNEGDPPTGAPGQEQAPAIPEPSAASVQLAVMVIGAVKPLLCFASKTLRVAPAELWEPLVPGVAGVLDHYDLSQSELLRNPWARLGLCAAPLVGYAVIHAEPEEKPAEPERLGGPDLSAAAPTAPAGSKVVTFGAPVAVAA